MAKMSRAKPLPKREPFSRKAAYVLANDVTAVAIYRLVSTVFGIILLGMVGYFSQRVISFEDDMRGKISGMSSDIMSLRERSAVLETALDMSNKRTDRIIDRVNISDKSIAALEARVDFLMLPPRR